MTEEKKDRKPRSAVVWHTVRTADEGIKRLKLTRKSGMACMCAECMGFEENPAGCTSVLCPLYPWRAGTRLTLKGEKNES